MSWLRVTGELKAGVKYIGIPEKEFEQLQARNVELEAKVIQQYDKGFLEGSDAQEQANRKHIIEPLEAENKQLRKKRSKLLKFIENIGFGHLQK